MSATVLLTGASGLVGQAVRMKLEKQGVEVRPLSHRDPAWDWTKETLDTRVLEGVTSVVHLAGEPIAEKRWSEAQKERIRSSRLIGTRAMAQAMAEAQDGPRTLVMASAIGLYGDRGEKELTERSEHGEGFLAEVVKDWESAADSAVQAGIRVVQLRLGIVLSPTGGALAKMLPPFRMGLGGPLGSGKAWMSWVHLEDVARAFTAAVTTPEWSGTYNLTAPQPETNLTFSKTLASTLSRPCMFPVPAVMLRLLFGEMADQALLVSSRVIPERLQEAGFEFQHPELASALTNLIKSP